MISHAADPSQDNRRLFRWFAIGFLFNATAFFAVANLKVMIYSETCHLTNGI